MVNKDKTRDQLTKELAGARRSLAQLELLEEERRWAQAELRKTARALKVLSGCNQVIVRATEESKLLEEVCQVIVDIGGYRLAWVCFVEPGRKKTVKPVAQRGYEQGYLETANITWADNERGRGPTGTAIRTAKSVVVRDILTDPTFAPWRREAIQRGFTSSIALPLGSGQPAFGALNIYATEPDAFDTEEVKLLTELANDLTYGITALRTEAERQRAEAALRLSEEKYRSLVDSALVGVYRSNLKGDILYLNKALVSMLGFDSIEETIASGALARYKDPGDRAILIKELTEKGRVNSLELELLTKTGEVKNVIINAILEGDTLSGMLIDITERKVTGAALRRSEERYHTALDSLMEGCQIIGFDWRYLYVNDSVAKQGHRTKEELLGHTMMEMYPGIENTEMFSHLRNCMGKRIPHHMENLFTYPDGSQGWFELSISPVPEGIFILSLDISEHKKMDEELSLRAQLLDAATDLIYVTDLNWNILYVNQASYQTLGYSRDELLGHNLLEFMPPEYAHRLPRAIPGTPAVVKSAYIRKDKTVMPVEVHSSIISWNGKKVVLAVVCDITEHKKEEEALRESEERYRTLVLLGAEVGEAIVILQDTEQGEGVQTFVSDPWLQITGYSREELLGKPFFDLLVTKDRAASIERHRRKMSNKAMPGLYEMTIITKDQVEVTIELTSAYTIYNGRKANVAYIRDITERKKRDEQLMLTDRLASIGQLASGIAHELNNPLTGVIGFSELLLEKTLPEDIREDLTTINKEARRTASVVKGLLTFARKQRTEKEVVDINRIIEEVLQLRSYEQRVSNIKVETRFAADLIQIMGNGAQLQQVFINLIINAEQAMLEAHGRGALSITTERAGDTVTISFADDGPGITPENMRRLFTPFFTTKEVGKGTGLGLSICHGIIAEHGGRIYAESEPGKGATFIVELPITKQ